MSGLNAVTVEGFTTSDPVIRQTKNGKSLCSFAVTVRHYSQGGAEPKVSFFDVETWDHLADFCSANISKGKRILVAGELRQERWDGEDGKHRSRIKLVAREVRFIDSVKDMKNDKAA